MGKKEIIECFLNWTLCIITTILVVLGAASLFLHSYKVIWTQNNNRFSTVIILVSCILYENHRERGFY